MATSKPADFPELPFYFNDLTSVPKQAGFRKISNTIVILFKMLV